MKRIWIAAAFLAISIGLCTLEQIYINKVYNDLNGIIARAEEYENDEDLFNAVKEIKAYWDSHNDLLFAISESTAVNELGLAVNRLDPRAEDFQRDLAELKTQNRFFYKNQRVTPANIF